MHKFNKHTWKLQLIYPIPTAHLIQDRVFGVTLLILLPLWLLSPSFCLSWLPETAVLWSYWLGGPICPLCNNTNPYLFGGWSDSLEQASLKPKAPSIRCLFSVSPTTKDCFFRLACVGSAAKRDAKWIFIANVTVKRCIYLCINGWRLALDLCLCLLFIKIKSNQLVMVKGILSHVY